MVSSLKANRKAAKVVFFLPTTAPWAAATAGETPTEHWSCQSPSLGEAAWARGKAQKFRQSLLTQTTTHQCLHRLSKESKQTLLWLNSFVLAFNLQMMLGIKKKKIWFFFPKCPSYRYLQLNKNKKHFHNKITWPNFRKILKIQIPKAIFASSVILTICCKSPVCIYRRQKKTYLQISVSQVWKG